MKLFVYPIAALMMIATAEAKKGGGKGGMSEKQKQEEQEKKERDEARDAKRDGVNEVLDEKDGNNDGSLTLEEFLTGESDVERATATFNEYNKNGDRYLTKMEIATMLGL